MAYASRAGRAHASMQRPRAFAVCDRCGIWWNHYRLSFQFDWAGASIANKRILVCPPCLDRPQQQLRAIILPADPVPVMNPRIELSFTAAASVRVVDGPPPLDHIDLSPRLIIPPDTRITERERTRVVQQTGEAPGGANQQPGTDPNAPPPINLPPGNDEVPDTGPL